ncbi:asparagine synthase-related protein (plasmid) [Halorussus salilacus]|uniref:asparagine synthase-related protein n=1 Tax=Halorussus salilacus TaxID=2953750 RepID=UPI0020A0BEF3|nr:asparagine synthase-related protein [Halorussus salilacus]USZ69968.1 asparagine synthase-related protein [Halorussus salilacus]
MVGVIGGNLTGDALTSAVERLDREEWYETERFEVGEAGLALVHHGEKDPGGHAIWEGDDGVGVCYGAVSNRDRLGLPMAEVFERVLDRPSVVLPELSGPFLLAVADRDGDLLVATDKLGTRDCYHAETPDGTVFGSDLGAVASRLDDPEVDARTASDLLSFGFALGGKTLVEGVDALAPATMLRVEAGEGGTGGRDDGPSRERYWEPTFGRLPEEGYVSRALSTYRRAVADASDTVEGSLGLWLSGGLDSRTMAGVLRREHGRFRTFTYDSNPPDASNLDPARRVAETLGVDNDLVLETPDDFARDFERAVCAFGGMVPHQNLVAPGFVFDDLHAKVDVMMEAAPQGEFLGEEVWTSHLDAPSAADAFLSMFEFRREPADRVRLLLDDPVEPDDSVREMVAESTKSSVPNRIMDTWFRNVPSNAHFRGNRAVRSQVGMRIPFADGDFLDTAAGMPLRRFRRATVPGTGGRIPRSMSPLKREVLVELDGGLDRIPYERTGFAPARPLALHDAGYVGKQLRWKFLTGRPSIPWSDWYRDREEVREPVDGWLDAARDRDLFEGDAVEDLRRDHLAGEADEWNAISGICNLEVWIEQALD